MNSEGMLSLQSASLVADLHDLCGECPQWDKDTGSVRWTDCVGLRFNQLDAATGASRTIHAGIEIYGFRRHSEGGWIICNPTGIWHWNELDPPTLLCSGVNGESAAFNDCCVDPIGRLITETFYYSPEPDYPLGNLVLLDIDGTTRSLDGGYHLANGLAFSPDGATLYATDTVLRRIYAYDYDVRRGDVSGKRLLVELDSTAGIPDGLAVDADGNLWSASWYGGCVHCFLSDGTLANTLPVPAKQVSSVAFGGPDLGDLYVTTAGQSEQLPVMPKGYDPTIGPFGGALYRARTGTYGIPQMSVAVRLHGVRQ